MEMLGKIRRMYLRDKMSLHKIAKHTGLSRNTIRRCPPPGLPPLRRGRDESGFARRGWDEGGVCNLFKMSNQIGQFIPDENFLASSALRLV